MKVFEYVSVCLCMRSYMYAMMHALCLHLWLCGVCVCADQHVYTCVMECACTHAYLHDMCV